MTDYMASSSIGSAAFLARCNRFKVSHTTPQTYILYILHIYDTKSHTNTIDHRNEPQKR